MREDQVRKTILVHVPEGEGANALVSRLHPAAKAKREVAIPEPEFRPAPICTARDEIDLAIAIQVRGGEGGMGTGAGREDKRPVPKPFEQVGAPVEVRPHDEIAHPIAIEVGDRDPIRRLHDIERQKRRRKQWRTRGWMSQEGHDRQRDDGEDTAPSAH